MPSRHRRRGGKRLSSKNPDRDKSTEPGGGVCTYRNPDRIKWTPAVYPAAARRSARVMTGLPLMQGEMQRKEYAVTDREQAFVDFLKASVPEGEGYELDQLVIDWIDSPKFGADLPERLEGLVKVADAVALKTVIHLASDHNVNERVRLRAAEVAMRVSGRLSDTLKVEHTHGVAEGLLDNAQPMMLPEPDKADHRIIDIPLLNASSSR